MIWWIAKCWKVRAFCNSCGVLWSTVLNKIKGNEGEISLNIYSIQGTSSARFRRVTEKKDRKLWISPFLYKYIESQFTLFLYRCKIRKWKKRIFRLTPPPPPPPNYIFWIRMPVFHKKGKASLRMVEIFPSWICGIFVPLNLKEYGFIKSPR